METNKLPRLFANISEEFKDFHFNYEDEDNYPQFKNMVDNLELSRFNINELRQFASKLKNNSKSMNKTNPELKYYLSMITKLVKEERERDIEEQFPYVRIDLDQLEKTSSNLVSYTLNQSVVLEEMIRTWLKCHFKYRNYIVVDLFDIISDGVIKHLNGKDDLVQWDAMIAVSNEDLKRIYFVETKSKAHKNDILGDKKCLQSRMSKTIELMADLKITDVNEIKNEKVYAQRAYLKRFVDYEIVTCYASNSIAKWIIDELATLKDTLGIKVEYIEVGNAFSLKVV